MTVAELIKKLKRYDPDSDVCLLDTRCLQPFLTEINLVRKASKREKDEGFFDEPIVIC